MKNVNCIMLVAAGLVVGILIGDFSDLNIREMIFGTTSVDSYKPDCQNYEGVDAKRAHELSANYRSVTDVGQDSGSNLYKQNTYFELTSDQIQDIYCTSRYITNNATRDFMRAFRFYFGKNSNAPTTFDDCQLMMVGLNKDKSEMLNLIGDEQGIHIISNMLPCPQQCDVDMINHSPIFSDERR